MIEMTRGTSQESGIDSQLIDILESIMPNYARVIRQAIADPNDLDRLTLPQLRAMQAISRADATGALNAHLARELQVAAPSMTAMIDGLVERGLVDRSIDPNNRRQVLILLTDAGTVRLAEMEEMMHTRLQQVIAHLNHEQRQRALDGVTLLQGAIASYHQHARETGDQ
jgi:DNA-binding MarR family transcriptional regulator